MDTLFFGILYHIDAESASPPLRFPRFSQGSLMQWERKADIENLR